MGAILFQTIFQIFAGTEALNSMVEEILNGVVERMQKDFMPIELKKHILGIFLSAMSYNAAATLKYLEQRQMSASLITEILGLSNKQLRSEYEKRLIVFGLSAMLMSQVLPISL